MSGNSSKNYNFELRSSSEKKNKLERIQKIKEGLETRLNQVQKEIKNKIETIANIKKKLNSKEITKIQIGETKFNVTLDNSALPENNKIKIKFSNTSNEIVRYIISNKTVNEYNIKGNTLVRTRSTINPYKE